MVSDEAVYRDRSNHCNRSAGLGTGKRVQLPEDRRQDS